MSRRNIYYWKCDRPQAFHGTEVRGSGSNVPESEIYAALNGYFEPDSLEIRPSSSQGNHLTWIVEIDETTAFLRIENGPEGDDYLEMESAIIEEVATSGVPVPRVLGCDASRTRVPFAWQLLEHFSDPDLNEWAKKGVLSKNTVALDIGRNVARWQNIRPMNYGPFQLPAWKRGEGLQGWHATYADYFRLRLDEHLAFLKKEKFLTSAQTEEISRAVDASSELLELDGGCLVHKDLALWNTIGTPDKVVAFIDFDDAISGDPMDDLSLLACFHGRIFLEQAFAGYQENLPLPESAMPRFWLHLLRNLIVKAVIRVGAGYFQRNSGFFLIGNGSSGGDLRTFTENRLATALQGLKTNADLSIL